MSGMAGGWYVRSPMAWRKSSRMGSISGEWKAWLTVSCLVFRPLPAHAEAIGSTRSAGPEITVLSGVFSAAMATRLAGGPISAASSSGLACDRRPSRRRPGARPSGGAGGDQPAGVGQVEHPGDVGGGDLADRMTDARRPVRSRPRPGAGQGDLEGEQPRLRVRRVVQQPGMIRILVPTPPAATDAPGGDPEGRRPRRRRPRRPGTARRARLPSRAAGCPAR